MKRSSLNIILIVTLSLVLMFQAAAVQARDITIVVSQGHGSASDDNTGSNEKPLATISRGLELAVSPYVGGNDVKVIVHAGTYRETLVWNTAPVKNGSLTLEAFGEDKVIVSGSEIWDDWVADREENVYTHYWPYKWMERSEKIKSSDVSETGKIKTLKWLNSASDLFLLRAMVFVDSVHHQQVLLQEELVPGKCYVNEDEEKIYLALAENINPNGATIEVATTNTICHITKSENITIKGLDFVHSNSIMKGAGLYISSCRNVLVEDCNFYYNNWVGIKLSTAFDVTLRNCISRDNGAKGIGGWRLKNVVMENCETYGNNWRGYASGRMDWDLGGMKVLHVHNCQVINHYSHDNYTYGIWFDTDNTEIVIRNSVITDNWHDGIFIERSQGPVTIDSCEISGNKRAGINIGSSDNVAITNNVITNNKYQLFVSSYGMEATNFETGSEYLFRNQNCKILNNVIEAGEEQRRFFYWLTPERYQEFLSTLTTDIER